MKQLKIVTRIAALLCYLAPFATCNFIGSDTSIATSDTVTIADQRSVDTSKPVDSLKTISITNPAADNNKRHEKTEAVEDSFWKRLYSGIFYPTDDSISGIGSIFLFNSRIGQISIALSFLLTLFLLFSWKFLKMKNRRENLLLVNLACILTFVFDGLLIDEQLLWGVWCLLGVVVFQIFFEYYTKGYH
jgi:hypothetical protein